MNVLSLFDGMSCGQIALDRLGVNVDNYYASEVDKYAIKVTQANYPDTIQLGDVEDWWTWNIDWSSIDLLIGGSPCQGFSFAGKQLAFDDPRSKLFFVYVDILDQIRRHNPDVKFLLENVRMKREFLDVISDYLGVEPVFINSALVSAQNRQRYYWANWNFSEPDDLGILLKDIVHEYFDRESELMRDKSCTIRVGGRSSPPFSKQSWDDVYHKSKVSTFNVNPSGKGVNGDVYSPLKDKSRTLTTNEGALLKGITHGNEKLAPLTNKGIDYMLDGNEKWGQAGECRLENYTQYKDRKSFTVTHNIHKGVPYNCYFQELNEYIVPFDKTLQILDKEVERGKVGYYRKDSHANRVYYIHDKAVTLLGNAGGGAAKMGQYLFGCITPSRINKKQNGQRFNEGKKFYTLTAQDQHGILIEGYIRKLTPVECERLQTVGDNYTDHVSNTQRYRMLGNGWTVDVICHILKPMIAVNEICKMLNTTNNGGENQ